MINGAMGVSTASGIDNGSEQADSDLVRAAQRGDRGAFASLVRRYQNTVGAVAYSLTGRFALSQDVAQEAFIVAWQRLREIDEPEKFRAFLLGVTRNKSLQALRDQRTEVGETRLSLTASDLASSDPSPLDRAIARDENQFVGRALSAIPEHYRTPLVLYYRENLSAPKVARAMGLSEPTVKIRLVRGRRMLAARLLKLVTSVLERTRLGEDFTACVMAAVLVLGGASASAASPGEGPPVGEKAPPLDGRGRSMWRGIVGTSAVVVTLGAMVLVARGSSPVSRGARKVEDSAFLGIGAANPRPPPRLATVLGPTPHQSEESSTASGRIIHTFPFDGEPANFPFLFGEPASCPPGIDAPYCALGTATTASLGRPWPWSLGNWKVNPHLGRSPGQFISFDYWLGDEDTGLEVQMGLAFKTAKDKCCWSRRLTAPVHRRWGHAKIFISELERTGPDDEYLFADHEEVSGFEIIQRGQGNGGLYVANIAFGVRD